jgi:hypothetical protein
MTLEEIMKWVDENVEKPFVTPMFSDKWKDRLLPLVKDFADWGKMSLKEIENHFRLKGLMEKSEYQKLVDDGLWPPTKSYPDIKII